MEGENSPSTPSDTWNSCAICCLHFLKINRLLEKGFCPPEDFFYFISGKVNKNTVECLGTLCCILLRIHYKEVAGNFWTFFPLFSLPQPASNAACTARVAGKDGASTQQILFTQKNIKLYLFLVLPGFICFELSLSKEEGGVKSFTKDSEVPAWLSWYAAGSSSKPCCKHSLWVGNYLFIIVSKMPSTGWLPRYRKAQQKLQSFQYKYIERRQYSSIMQSDSLSKSSPKVWSAEKYKAPMVQNVLCGWQTIPMWHSTGSRGVLQK